MDYLGLQKLPLGQDNGTAQQYLHGRALQHHSATTVLQNTALYGPQATADLPTQGQLNRDRGLKQANTKDDSPSDRTGDQNPANTSSNPSTSASNSPSPPPQRTPLDKPLEELTEEDIMHLTREDCRRYLKEKGMRRPSWNKSQAIQQVLSLKGLFDSKGDDEKRLRPSNGPKRLAKEPSVTQEPPDLQQKRPAPHTQQTLVAMTQQSLPTVVNERSQEPCTTSSRVPQRSGRNDLHTTHQLSASQSACPNASVSSVVDHQLARNLPAYARPLDSTIAATALPLEKNNVPSQTTCSQCVQTIGVIGRQPSAQLTIFYSGMVNVYDDVPADKAQAIMLLAASGNILKHSPCLHTQAPMNVPISTLVGTTASSLPTPYYVHSAFATAQAPLTAMCPSVSVSVSQGLRAMHSEQQQPSRKACLQRYLEKRRGRYGVRAPYLTSTKVAGGDIPPQLMAERCKMSVVYEMAGPSSGFPHLDQGQMPTQSSGSETSSPHTSLQKSSHKHTTSQGQRSCEKQSIVTDGKRRCSSEVESSSLSQVNASQGLLGWSGHRKEL